jgi:hypothetical protein
MAVQCNGDGSHASRAVRRAGVRGAGGHPLTQRATQRARRHVTSINATRKTRMPTKTPCGQTLGMGPHVAHQVLHCRQLRIKPVNGRVQRCRTVQDRSCLWHEGIRARVLDLCCALHAFRVRLTPWQPMRESGYTPMSGGWSFAALSCNLRYRCCHAASLACGDGRGRPLWLATPCLRALALLRA